MNVLVPVNDRAYLGRYVQAGGDEFYVGFHDEAWHARFGRRADLNRMTGFREQANPYSFEEVLSLAEDVRALGKRLYVTFNANAYSRTQIDFLFGYFERLHAAGATGVIVSVPEVVEPAADSGLEVVASTMCGVYNEQIARVLRGLGCTRVIVPRDVTLSEIEDIMQAVPDLEYEVFLMRNGCIFSDGYCLGRHAQGRNALCFDVRDVRREFLVDGLGERGREVRARGLRGREVPGQNVHEQAHLDRESSRKARRGEYVQGTLGKPPRGRLSSGQDSSGRASSGRAALAAALRKNNRVYGRFHRTACGLCALWRLERAGVAAAKIVGRSDDSACILRDIEAIRRNADIARACATEREYLERMEIPPERAESCASGLSCYYPEVRFG